MNRLVKLASAIGILVMFIVVLGGVPTATAQDYVYITSVRIECNSLPFLAYYAGGGLLLGHSGTHLGWTGEMRCGDIPPYPYEKTYFVQTTASQGIPNDYKITVSVWLAGIRIKTCPFGGPLKFNIFGYMVLTCEFHLPEYGKVSVTVGTPVGPLPPPLG